MPWACPARGLSTRFHRYGLVFRGDLIRHRNSERQALPAGNCGFHGLRVAMTGFGDGLVQDAHGIGHLPLDDAELFFNRDVSLAQQEVYAKNAGFDGAERLPQIVRQARDEIFGIGSGR